MFKASITRCWKKSLEGSYKDSLGVFPLEGKKTTTRIFFYNEDNFCGICSIRKPQSSLMSFNFICHAYSHFITRCFSFSSKVTILNYKFILILYTNLYKFYTLYKFILIIYTRLVLFHQITSFPTEGDIFLFYSLFTHICN